MTRHRIAQIGENRNPKSPEPTTNTPFLANSTTSAPPFRYTVQRLSRSSRTTNQAHFAAEYIAQLRQTLDAGAAKEVAHLSCLASPDRHVVVPFGYRRAEPKHLKPAPAPTDAGL